VYGDIFLQKSPTSAIQDLAQALINLFEECSKIRKRGLIK